MPSPPPPPLLSSKSETAKSKVPLFYFKNMVGGRKETFHILWPFLPHSPYMVPKPHLTFPFKFVSPLPSVV